MDFQECSPAQQFEGINSLALCLLYGPDLTIIRDQWEDHSLDYTTFVGRVMSLNLNLSLTLEKTSPALWEQNYKRYDFVASRYRHLM